MRPIRHLFVVLFTTAIMCFCSVASQAQGQVVASPKAPIHACDTLAGNPIDPQKVGVGVATALLRTEPAIRACEEAVRLYPNELRFQFQLGRAYKQANRLEEAFRLYKQSADKGYAGAQNSLGVMYARGESVPKDCNKAAHYFQLAADQGLQAAGDNLRLLACVQQV
ncbi:MAG: sel1 repeat family protein [Parcubacteria group bacterium]|nr:sel1 repeat family protein [Parcubacteria group bacterium]